MRRTIAGLGLVLGLAAIGLQAWLTFPASAEAGRSLFGTTVFFFSFFTILCNCFLVLVYAAEVFPGAGVLSFFRRSSVIGFGAPAIALVMIIYHLLLASLWSPEGLWYVADMLLHTATPVLFLLWWLVFVADGSLTWRVLPGWVGAPLVYLGYVLIRGAATGDYPYPILDMAELGVATVARNIGFVVILFLGLSGLALLADRLIGRRRGRG